MKSETFSNPNSYPSHNSLNGNGTARQSHKVTQDPSPHSSSSPEAMGEQSVILEQPGVWSRVFIWLLVSATTSAAVWAASTQLDQTVVATGKLEPQGAVKEIKAPTGGVVREIHVKDGQPVKKEQILLTFDPTAPEADIKSLTQLRATLVRENQFYNGVTHEKSQSADEADLTFLTKLRTDLTAENQFYKAITNGINPKAGTDREFNANQQRLLAASQAEIQSSVAAAQFQIQELEKQRSQTLEQLETAKKVLAVNQGILQRIAPLATQEGAISKLQHERQQQEVLTRLAEVNRLISEEQRQVIAISQAREKLKNTIALAAKDIHSKIAENQKRIAEIDTELGKARLDNKKKIAEIDAQISKAKQALQYQEFKAPVNGVVFDLQPHSAGFVVSETQTLLKVVPNDSLIASVVLTNKDIGFVKEGMSVDVRIDSFPSTEFGSIKGKLIWIGSDALAPTQERPFYAFPAKIQLEHQSLSINGKSIPLQSGMAVNSSIIVRKRPILSILTDLFDKQVKSVESIR